MTVSEFKQILESNPEKQFQLMLPNQTAVPVAFHITEVAHVQKRFIDCRGRKHTTDTCQLQAWLGEDIQHRLKAGRMADILRLAADVLPADRDLDIEIEYEDTAISQYPIADYTVTTDAVVLSLGYKHTDCLAKELCLPKLPMVAGIAATGCCDPTCGC